MTRRAPFLVLAAAVAAVAAVPLSMSFGKSSSRDVSVAVIGGGEAKGLVAATHQRGKSKLRLSVSIRGLEPTASYRLTASTRSCSKRRRGPTVFTLDAKPTPTSTAKAEVFLPSARVRAKRPLRSAKSLRIQRLTPDGTVARQVCKPFIGGSGDGQSI